MGHASFWSWKRPLKRFDFACNPFLAGIYSLQLVFTFRRLIVKCAYTPFSGGGKREITGQPKVYGFDSGFVCHCKGWTELRPDDHGILYEHLVLASLRTIFDENKIHFWRDKQHREVDFIIERGRSSVDAIECKWNANSFEPRGLKAFRENYPDGRNYVVSSQTGAPVTKRVGELEVIFTNLLDLRACT